MLGINIEWGYYGPTRLVKGYRQFLELKLIEDKNKVPIDIAIHHIAVTFP
jgi:hypothetical protein